MRHAIKFWPCNSLACHTASKRRFADNTAKTQVDLQDMVNRLVGTERKYGMEINIEKSQVKRVSRSNED